MPVFPSTKVSPRRMFQLRLPFLMVLIAFSGLIFWALRYREENLNVQRSLMLIRIHELADGDDSRRRWAAEILGDTPFDELGLVLPALAFGTRDAKPEVRRVSIQSLVAVISRAARPRDGAISEEIASVTPLLVAALKDENPTIRAGAAQGLGRLQGHFISPITSKPVTYGPNPQRVVPALLEAMKDPDAKVRAEVVVALGYIAPAAEDAPAALLEAMTQDTSEDVRVRAARALCRPWRNVGALWEPMLMQMESPSERVRVSATWGLTILGTPPLSALPAISKALDSPNPLTRSLAPKLLAQFGAAAKPLLPKLLVLAREQINHSLMLTAIDAIIAIDPDSPEAQALVVPLATMLGDHDSPIKRQYAAIALSNLGRSAAPAVPTLIEALNDPLEEVRSMAAFSLQKIGPASRPALPLLHQLALQELSSVELSYFRFVAPILAIDAGSPEALSLLILLAKRAMAAKSLQTQYIEWEAVGQILKNGEAARAIVKNGLNDPDPATRAASAEIERRFGNDLANNVQPGKSSNAR